MPPSSLELDSSGGIGRGRPFRPAFLCHHRRWTFSILNLRNFIAGTNGQTWVKVAGENQLRPLLRSSVMFHLLKNCAPTFPSIVRCRVLALPSTTPRSRARIEGAGVEVSNARPNRVATWFAITTEPPLPVFSPSKQGQAESSPLSQPTAQAPRYPEPYEWASLFRLSAEPDA